MSYGAAAALQRALYARLRETPELAGVELHDALPPALGGTFVLLGAEEVRDASDASGAGAEHRITLSVISDAAGFLAAKAIAVAICAAMEVPFAPLEVGQLVGVSFLSAQARRLDEGRVRRIDLRFRMRIAF